MFFIIVIKKQDRRYSLYDPKARNGKYFSGNKYKISKFVSWQLCFLKANKLKSYVQHTYVQKSKNFQKKMIMTTTEKTTRKHFFT